MRACNEVFDTKLFAKNFDSVKSVRGNVASIQRLNNIRVGLILLDNSNGVANSRLF